MIGEELDRKFFEEVLGWERLEDQFYAWREPDGTYHYRIPLHKSLDLQEEWVWPELRKKYADPKLILFVNISYLKDDTIAAQINLGTTVVGHGYGETKALAQLTAALKALGKL